jgi:hypothetical protein
MKTILLITEEKPPSCLYNMHHARDSVQHNISTWSNESPVFTYLERIALNVAYTTVFFD